MFSEQFQKLLREAAAATGLIAVGVILSLLIAEFNGELEIRLTKEEGYIKVIGLSNQCPLSEEKP